MAGQPIKITLDVDTQRAATDLRRFADQLDEVADSTKDTDRALSNAARTLAGDLRRDLDRAEQSASDLSRTFDRDLTGAMKDTSRQAKRTGDDISRETKDATRHAGEATGEFRQEASQNFSEVASSFQGDMTSAVDLVQGTLGGLATSAIPGLSAAAGGAGIAIGAIFTTLNSRAEATKQQISDLTQAMIDANSQVVAESFIQGNLKDIVSGDGVISMENLRTAAEQTGIQIGVLARAYAGDPGSVAQAIADVQRQWDQADRDRQSLDAGVVGDAINRQNELARWKDDLERLSGSYDSASSAYGVYQEAVAAGEQRNQAAIGETRKAYEDAHRAVDAIPTSKSTTVTVDVDTTQADRKLRNWRPVVVANVRFGKAVV